LFASQISSWGNGGELIDLAVLTARSLFRKRRSRRRSACRAGPRIPVDGMAGAFRRSEPVPLRVEDIARDYRGLRIEPPPMATTRDRE
jgi:hypothetical protein